jgi:2,5-diamino-6-(ribosylamino)-4(3H)-pyrimidinone 5'-phosphate reductase
MLPKIIIHNVISLNGCLTGFEPNLERYYQIAGSYKHDVVLVGSNTAKAGFDMFLKEIPTEKKSDFVKPDNTEKNQAPLWVVPDSRGILQNLLHVLRQSEYCKDVIVLVSKNTPESYIKYLEKRNYDYIKIGVNHVDYKSALEILYNDYNVRDIRSDSGGTLNSILLEQGLVDKISLLISPVIVGKGDNYLFGGLNPEKYNSNLKLIKNEIFEDNSILLVYKVLK